MSLRWVVSLQARVLPKAVALSIEAASLLARAWVLVQRRVRLLRPFPQLSLCEARRLRPQACLVRWPFSQEAVATAGAEGAFHPHDS